MLVSLMVMGVCTMGVTAWVAIINGRTGYTESLEEAMNRRVSIENSRALAEEYMYVVAANLGAGDAVTATVDGGDTAKVQISGWSGGAFASVIQPGGINRSGMANGHLFQDSSYTGYVRYYDIELGNGDHQITRSFQLRSRAPMLAGDLVTLHDPTLTPAGSFNTSVRLTGNVHVYGRTVFWRPDLLDHDAMGRFRSREYALMSGAYGDIPIQNLPEGSVGEDRIRASNFPATPITAGPAGGGLGFDGKMSSVKNESSTLNSLYDRLVDRSDPANPVVNAIEANGLTASNNRGVVSNGGGTISIDLNNEFLSDVLIQNDTSRIILNGQSMVDDAPFIEAGNRSAILILIIQDDDSERNLDRIELTNRNSRRVVVAIKKTVDSFWDNSALRTRFRWMDSGDDPSWRLVAIGENSEILFEQEENGSATIYGGVRTDRGFYSDDSSSKNFFIYPESDPKLLERLLDRNVWLESYAN